LIKVNILETSKQIIKLAVNTILTEANTISDLAKHIDKSFASAVSIIFNSKGRLIITGIGKSAIIAQKIVATLNSTGTPAVFMHAADAIHGDLGIILEDDIVLCLSKSGNTPEIKVLVPIIKNRGNIIIGMVSNKESYLAEQSDYVLYAPTKNEACPNNLAPTSSTTAQLVLGDALAICLLDLRGFSAKDFAKFHPGGSLGKKLYMRVSDLYSSKKAPYVKEKSLLKDIIFEISAKRLGAAAVINDNNEVIGIITDGDLRRMMEKFSDFNNVLAKDIMNINPKTINPNELAINAYYLMENNKITQLIVSENNKYINMIHLHDILQEGIV